MLAVISFLFILLIASQLEADIITIQQAIVYIVYGILMFYHTSKPYFIENKEESKKKRTNAQDHQSRN